MKTWISQSISVCLLCAGLLVFHFPSALEAADITAPGDPITPSSPNHPGAEDAPKAIDNRVGLPGTPTPSASKYLNFDELNTGFTVTPSTVGVPVTGLAII